jgi:hypothetical protein
MVTAKNPITGDTIASKPTNDAYRDNFDAIFRKTKRHLEHEPENEPHCSEGARPAPPELEQAVKRSIDNRVQWPFPTVNGERQ